MDELRIRWMLRKELPTVLRIEGESFPWPWSVDDFVGRLRRRTCIGMVAERAETVIGYMVYELEQTRIVLLNLAVDVAARRQGVGRAMIEKLRKKLSARRRAEIVATLREGNLPGQCFLRACGFRCVMLCRRNYEEEETAEDGYLFRHRLPGADACPECEPFMTVAWEYQDLEPGA